MIPVRTPTEAKAIERARLFRAHIARKAAELEAKKAAPIIQPIIKDKALGNWPEKQSKNWFTLIDEVAPRPDPSIALIQRTCCNHFDVTLNDLLSPRRIAAIVYARQVAMFLAKDMTKRSLPEIGRRFGGRDHTTVLHAVRKIAIKSISDPQLAVDIGELRAEIRRFG